MLKKFPWRQRTKHRTPTTKNGKFVITFNELGTPVKYPDERIIPISQNSSMHITYTQIHIEAWGGSVWLPRKLRMSAKRWCLGE